MSITTATRTVTRRQGVAGHVCARHDWHRQVNFAGRGIVMGIERKPQPKTYEGRGSR